MAEIFFVPSKTRTCATSISHATAPNLDGDPVSVQREFLIPPTPANERTNIGEQTATVSSDTFTVEQPELPVTIGQEHIEQPAQDAPYLLLPEWLLTETGVENLAPDSSTTSGPHLSIERDLEYEHQDDAANDVYDIVSTQSSPPGQEGQVSAPFPKQPLKPGQAYEQNVPDVPDTGVPAMPESTLKDPSKIIRMPEPKPEITIEKANGNSFVVSGEFFSKRATGYYP